MNLNKKKKSQTNNLKKPQTLALIKNIFGMDGRMDGGMEGGMDGRMDGGWTVGWTLDGRDGHGKRTGSGKNRKIYCMFFYKT
jgi:hypothetical protein